MYGLVRTAQLEKNQRFSVHVSGSVLEIYTRTITLFNSIVYLSSKQIGKLWKTHHTHFWHGLQNTGLTSPKAACNDHGGAKIACAKDFTLAIMKVPTNFYPQASVFTLGKAGIGSFHRRHKWPSRNRQNKMWHSFIWETPNTSWSS